VVTTVQKALPLSFNRPLNYQKQQLQNGSGASAIPKE